jgi:hypothetical protein
MQRRARPESRRRIGIMLCSEDVPFHIRLRYWSEKAIANQKASHLSAAMRGPGKQKVLMLALWPTA